MQMKKDYPVDIEISAYDRPGILNDVMHAVSEAKTNILAVTGRADREKIATIHLTIAINNISGLHKVVEKIKQCQECGQAHFVILVTDTLLEVFKCAVFPEFPDNGSGYRDLYAQELVSLAVLSRSGLEEPFSDATKISPRPP